MKFDDSIYNLIISTTTKSDKVDDNKTLDDDNEYLDRINHSFSDLLTHYVDKTKETYETNKKKKDEFYELFKNIFYYSYVFFLIAVAECTLIYLVINDPIIFSAVIPFFLETLSVTIIIPKIIAKYLFNTEEEKNLADVISNIQKHNEIVRTYKRESENEH